MPGDEARPEDDQLMGNNCFNYNLIYKFTLYLYKKKDKLGIKLLPSGLVAQLVEQR